MLKDLTRELRETKEKIRIESAVVAVNVTDAINSRNDDVGEVITGF